MLFRNSLAIRLTLLAVTPLCGCSVKPPQESTEKTTITPDDLASVAALESAGAKLRRDGNGNIDQVDFRGTGIDDQPLSHLAGLPSLRVLKLMDTNVTDAGMSAIAQATSLVDLDLRGCAISNDGIAAITGLSKLRALRLSGKSGKTNVDDDAMQHIAKFTNLKSLAMDFLTFAASAEGIEQITGLTHLEELYVANTLVDDEALAVIAKFPKLKKLRVAANQVSSDGLQYVAQMSAIEDLDLSENSQIFDDGLAAIAGMKQLKKLNLWRVQVTDDGMQHLAGLTNLESLNLDNIGLLTNVGLRHLRGLSKLTFLHLGSTAITDEDVAELEPLTSLEELNVTRTGVTQAGVDKLKKKLTNTKIQLEYIPGA